VRKVVKAIRIFVTLLLFLAVASVVSPTVHAAPSLLASGDPGVAALYTTRDKQVSLTGSGYAPNQAYYVWVKTPKNNRTLYSGTSFTALASGLIPPTIGFPIPPNATLGTYLVTVSNSTSADTGEARAHFGIWGTVKPLYQRTESVLMFGGGLFPGVSFKLSIRDSAGAYVKTTTIASDVSGNFNYTWRIPSDAVAGTYEVFIDGTGTFDNSQQGYVSESKFTVTPAVLAVKVAQQPSLSYQRTETATFSFGLSYPDGSPVIKSDPTIRPVTLLRNQSTVVSAAVSLIDASNGIWGSNSKIAVNATLSSKYRFLLPAMSFDDGSGNKGGAIDTYSQYFQVQNASLVIKSVVNGTQIQVPFGQVGVISRISYPDGTPMTNGTVMVSVSTDSSTHQLALKYDPTLGAWRGSYSSSLSDLWSVGKWTLQVEAADVLGNSGTSTYGVTAQPYLFLILIGGIIAVVLFSRWTISRYGRKVYFRIRKMLQRLRSLSTGRSRP
jgi:hypothetical protein